MATIRKKRSKYQALVSKKNIKLISKTFTLKEDAEKWAKEIGVNIEKGFYQNNSSSKSITLKAILKKYRDKVSVNKKGHYIDKYKIDKLCRFPLVKSTLDKLSPLQLSSFVDEIKKILKKEEKTKQIENFILFDRHFHHVGGYIAITILYLIWALNKI
jgi:hypothetical protein